MGEAGIVIVTCNSAGEIGPCVDAALSSGAETIVVDNASQDETLAEVRRRPVRLIANEVNRGFAGAVNQGIRALSAPFVLLLNPDAVLETGLDRLVEACRRPGAAGASGKLLSPDGSPQTGFMFRRLPTTAVLVCEALGINRIWPHNPANWHYRCFDRDHDAPQQVEQPAGAFLMLRRDAWEALGGLDEGFFPLWFEDVDYCRRARDRGYAFHYVPYAVAKHTGGHSIPKIPVEKRELYWYGSVLRYVRRHLRAGDLRAVAVAVLAGSVLRMMGGVVRARSFAPIRVYVKVMRLAGRELVGAGKRTA